MKDSIFVKKIKLVLYILVLILILGLFGYEIYIGKTKLNKESIQYSKDSNINYVTYLKDNNYYNSSYLQNEYNLVANLIDYFNVDYNYSYALSDKIDYTLNYEINAVLEIYDVDNPTKPVEKKNYVLLEKQTKKAKGQVIKVDVYNQKINYNLYDQIVQSWKKEISPNAKLRVTFKVNWNGHSEKLNKDISDSLSNEFSIPISEKTIDIKKPNAIHEEGTLKKEAKFSRGYSTLIISTLILFIIGLMYLIHFIGDLQKDKSKFDKTLSKIIREFDRAITEAKGEFIMYEDETYIEVKDFMELIDVHDNTNEPIVHYSNNNNLSVFVVKNNNETYYTVLKRSDYDK